MPPLAPRLALATAVSLLAAPAAAADGNRRPNVIVILADDMGYADVGFQGCTDIPTPHLDALAKAGVRCTDGYVSCPVCSPARAGLLTGRYQQRFGHEYNPSLGKGVGLPLTEVTVADRLRAAGYATGAIGKWHLGKEPPFHPLARGFTEFYGFVGGGRSYFPMTEPSKDRFVPLDPIVRGRTRVSDPEYLTDAFGQEAAAFVERHKAEPFFLYLAFNATHYPLQATEKYLSRFPTLTGGRRTLAAMTSALDDAVGVVTAKLRAEGLERDTLVFFLSDNGGPRMLAARNDPLRGQKSTAYEGGIRVPFVVAWPGHLPAGGTYSRPVISLDILPTALAAAGVTPPAAPPLDGVNLLPHLTGRAGAPPHEALYWRYGNERAVRRGDWKLTMPAREPAGLYDLSADVAEAHDLSAARPAVVAELTRLYERWAAELQPPRWRDLMNLNAPGPASKAPPKP
ncbi:MAG TPA: sulfatase-like hydrolase/transferase [Gemmataceae bacterium]|jgi:arylsulfatase A-like enzyme